MRSLRATNVVVSREANRHYVFTFENASVMTSARLSQTRALLLLEQLRTILITDGVLPKAEV